MEIKNFREINKGCLKASLTIVISEWGQMEVDCIYFEKEDNTYWVNYAPKEYTTQDGRKKTWNQVRWNKPTMDRLNLVIREKMKQMASKPVQEIIDDLQEEELPF